MLDVADLSLLGGHLALDFVNTIEDRQGVTPDDVLRTPGDLVRWGERMGLGPAGGSWSQSAPDELALAVRFREDLHAVLEAAVEGARPPRAELRRVERTVTEAYDARRLEPGPRALRWTWSRPGPALVRYEVSLAAGDLLTSPALLERTRRCSAQLCGWFYLDQSKNRSRRWCSMRGCGTREKARRRIDRERA